MHSACRGCWRCPREHEPAGTNTQMQATCMMSEQDTQQHDMIVHFTRFMRGNGGKGRYLGVGVRMQASVFSHLCIVLLLQLAGNVLV